MKKNNFKIQLLLSTLIFIGLIIFEIWCAFDFYTLYKDNKKAYNNLIVECEKGQIDISKEACESIIQKGEPVVPDTISFFFIVIMNTGLDKIQLIAPMLIIIMSSYTFYRKYKTNFYKNELIRTSYKKYLKKAYLNALKSIWLFPVSLVILFIVCFLLSGHFDLDKTLSYWAEGSIPINISHIRNFIPFIFIYILNIVLNSWFYVNLSLIPIKKNFNLIVSVLSSYILFLFCDIFLEVIVGVIIFEKYLQIHQASNIFNLFNYWVYDGINKISSLTIFTIYNLVIVIISFVILYIIYRNKEDVVIESEK